MAPSPRITHLAERLRGRLHGDIRDINPDFVPGNKSSDARLRFDQYVEEEIKQKGKKEVEKMLQHFYDKVKDIDHEAELRVWEMIYGPERTFGGRAFKWGIKEEETYRRAQCVRAVYEKEENGRKEERWRKEEEPKTRQAWEQEQEKVKAGGSHGQEKEISRQGSHDHWTQAGGQNDSTPIYKPQGEPRRGAPAPTSRHRTRGD